MHLSEEWEDEVVEDYLIYLERLDPDVSPISQEAFEWMKVRELKLTYAEALME